jgi:hypothetical protein
MMVNNAMDWDKEFEEIANVVGHGEAARWLAIEHSRHGYIEGCWWCMNTLRAS